MRVDAASNEFGACEVKRALHRKAVQSVKTPRLKRAKSASAPHFPVSRPVRSEWQQKCMVHPLAHRSNWMSLRRDLFDSVAAGSATTRVLLVADRGRTDLRDLLAGTLRTVNCVIQNYADLQFEKPPMQPDLILVDLSLPDEMGFKICRELYYFGVRAPILMWNRARTDVGEFLSSVRLLLTRSLDGRSGGLTEFAFGSIHVEFARGAVTRAGMPVRLSAKEFQLLRYLICWRGSVLSRAELLDAVWQYKATATRTLDVHVSLLRQKLEDTPHRPRHILTLRGRGYFFQ